MIGFNLIDDAWMPVRTVEGARVASLREVLTAPEAFVGLDYDEVDEFFALLRLLTTIVNRALDGPRTADDWAEIAYEDGYEVAAIQAYLNEWKHRFELLDPERPFLQFPELAGEKDAASLSVLLPSISSGNAITLFSHASEHDALALTPARAARALVHVVLNGRGSLKGGEYGVFGSRVAVLGSDLKETIVGNLPRHRGEEDGIPVWERSERRVLPEKPTKATDVARGLLDLSTWQWRAVLLRCSGNGLVTSCVYGHGPRPAGEEPRDPARWYDPQKEDALAKDPSLPPWRDHRMRAAREPWRDADALVAALARDETAGVLAWTASHREADEFDVLVGGPIVELKGSWVLTGMRQANLPIPKALLVDDKLRSRVAAAIEHATAVARALWGAVHVLARELVRTSSDVDPSKRRADEVARTLQAEPRFWAALPTAFERFLRHVADGQAMVDWKAQVDAEARRALDEVMSGLADSPRALRAAAMAQRSLHRSLRSPGAPKGRAPSPTGAQV